VRAHAFEPRTASRWPGDLPFAGESFKIGRSEPTAELTIAHEKGGGGAASANGMEYQASVGPRGALTKTEIRNSTVRVIRQLVALTQSMPPLPASRAISMKAIARRARCELHCVLGAAAAAVACSGAYRRWLFSAQRRRACVPSAQIFYNEDAPESWCPKFFRDATPAGARAENRAHGVSDACARCAQRRRLCPRRLESPSALPSARPSTSW
jgi:hypothetical protein